MPLGCTEKHLEATHDGLHGLCQEKGKKIQEEENSTDSTILLYSAKGLKQLKDPEKLAGAQNYYNTQHRATVF